MAKRDKESSDQGAEPSARLDVLRARFLGEAPRLAANAAGSRTMAKKTAEQIVREKHSAKRVVQSAPAPAPKPDAVSRDLSELRRKYFGSAAGDAARDPAASQASRPSPDTEIVLVVPADPSADPANALPKGIVVTDGEETGRQG